MTAPLPEASEADSLPGKRFRPRIQRKRRPKTQPNRRTEAGASLLLEAKELLIRHKWKDALRVLDAAGRLRPTDPSVLRLRAVAASHGRVPEVTHESLNSLAEWDESSATTWAAVSEVAIANHRYGPAEHAAREAIIKDSQRADSWFNLAAAYAGRGWFDEAAECLAQGHALDDAEASGMGEWRIGRAVNMWAMTRTITPVITIICFVFLGLLGVAIGLSTPMVTREIRIRQLDRTFTEMATQAWSSDFRTRLIHGAFVLAAVVGWLVVLSLTGTPGGVPVS